MVGVARTADDQRDLEALAVEAELGDLVVLAELLAVVGGQHEERVVVLAAGLQERDQPTECRVDLR